MMKAETGVICFEDERRGSTPKETGSHKKLKRQGNRFSPQSLMKEPALLTPSR